MLFNEMFRNQRLEQAQAAEQDAQIVKLAEADQHIGDQVDGGQDIKQRHRRDQLRPERNPRVQQQPPDQPRFISDFVDHRYFLTTSTAIIYGPAGNRLRQEQTGGIDVYWKAGTQMKYRQYHKGVIVDGEKISRPDRGTGAAFSGSGLCRD